ncbi:conserved hypothetical protein [Gloeothece citriformis PCC 7424]|uniref:Chromophore lyase CpcS/CpeS n=1 Tax=Gloeothece citriformis (strain PCC 7424) TaxID=65393 RepID=B7KEK8_GLOC7|nr:phycobiliprotein lyase [Gloeothece citriformis]ACK69033.1 conserved hypothetical protein [Gloeothece citriformis PCC 7424]
MEIREFLDLWVDRWFALRTSYQLDHQKIENSKSEITVERLPIEHPEVIKLCEQYQIDPSLTLGGIKTSWDNSVDWGKSKQTGATIVVWIPTENNSATGQLLQKNNSKYLKGRYSLGDDEALTLIVEETDSYFEERVWFASPNLRLRNSLIKNGNGFSQTAFYSEIRRVAPKN